MPGVGIVMGSDSDLKVMSKAAVIFSFLAIFQVLQLAFLIFHVF